MSNLVVVPPGAYIFAEYTANWEGADWPEGRDVIELQIVRKPVVGIVYQEGAEGYRPQFVPVFLNSSGTIDSGEESTPYDWGEEGVDLGIFPADVDLGTLKALALSRCWARCCRNKDMEAKKAKAEAGPKQR